MIKYTPNYLQKLEGLIKENNYVLRNEKGNFKSGYCLLKDSKVIVINKFATLETRINALIEILKELNEKETLSANAMEELAGIEKSKSAGKKVPANQ
jgi:hypothetical protein